MPAIERRGYRLHEVEQMFGISRMSVRRAINAGTISTFKIGGVVLVRVEDIDRLTQPTAASQAAA